jgi:tRNA (guanine-N7-)-methyltransferase
MPGRGPKKRGDGFDVTGHLLPLARLLPGGLPTNASEPWLSPPVSPVAVFPSKAAVELEVGCGKGLFLASAAAARPDCNYLGVELAPGYAELTAARCLRHGCSNARVICGDGTLLIRCLLADRSLEAVHVYFPDPWWKARHRKRRVLSEPFFRAAARTLVHGGLVHVWTDVEEYFREAVESAVASGLFGSPREVAERPAADDFDYRTHFERRTRLADQPVWRAELPRNDLPAPPRQPLTPHELLRLQPGTPSSSP